MKIFFCGSTSDTGNRVLKKLVSQFGKNSITCLVRYTSDVSVLEQLGVKIVIGDVTDPIYLQKLISCDSIYLDMTHPKYYHNSLKAVTQSNISRAYFVTTTGIFSKYNNLSQIYIENERKIKESGINYTILRPSMIYGSSKDKNMHKLIQFLYKYPIFPLFTCGKSLMQPVYVEDLANGIVAAICNPVTVNQEYNLAGPNPIAFQDIVDTILKILEKKVLKLEINHNLASRLVKLCENIPNFPINQEQVLRLKEDKVFDISKAVREIEFNPREFSEGIFQEINEMRTIGRIK